MIVIAYNYNNKIIGIVNAENEKLANAFWHGRGITPHSTKVLERDFTKLEEHPHGVYPILETIEKYGYELNTDFKRNSKFILVK